jgi:hypothetical protein
MKWNEINVDFLGLIHEKFNNQSGRDEFGEKANIKKGKEGKYMMK